MQAFQTGEGISSALPPRDHPGLAAAVAFANARAQAAPAALFVVWWDAGTLTVQKASVAPPTATAVRIYSVAFPDNDTLILRAAGAWQKLKDILA